MIGQQKLVAQIVDLIERDKFPRFSIVVGERGMEHEDVGRVVAQRLECPYILLQDVKVDTIRDMIVGAYRLHEKLVYIIPHADDMSINAKNALLKVVEDTPNKAYFVMCLEDLSNTLATIQSRGIVFRMSRPSMKDIENFAESLYINKSDVNKELLDLYAILCVTPGDVLYFQKHNIHNFYSYAEWVADNIFTMNGAEVFKISDKLALKDEEDKYDVLLFLRALQNRLMIKCAVVQWHNVDKRNCYLNIVGCIGRYMQDLRIKGVNRAMLMDNLYLEMRKIWKSQM